MNNDKEFKVLEEALFPAKERVYNTEARSTVRNPDNIKMFDTIRTNHKVDLAYEGSDLVAELNIGVKVLDFSRPNNGTGFYHDVTNGFCVVKNDAGMIQESGTIILPADKSIALLTIESLDSVNDTVELNSLYGLNKIIRDGYLTLEETDDLIRTNDETLIFKNHYLTNKKGVKYYLRVSLLTNIKYGRRDDNERFISGYNAITLHSTMLTTANANNFSTPNVFEEQPNEVKVSFLNNDIENISYLDGYVSYGKFDNKRKLDNIKADNEVMVCDFSDSVMGVNSKLIINAKTKGVFWNSDLIDITEDNLGPVKTLDSSGVERKINNLELEGLNVSRDFILKDVQRLTGDEFEMVDSIDVVSYKDEFYLALGAYSVGSTYLCNSFIYKLNKNSGMFEQIKAVATNGCKSVAFMNTKTGLFVFFGNNRNGSDFSINSEIYKFNDVTKDFTKTQDIFTNGCLTSSFFTTDGEDYLFVGNYFDNANYVINSFLFKFNVATGLFEKIQDIETIGVSDSSISIHEGEVYLFSAHCYNGTTYEVQSHVLKFNKVTELFEKIQDLPSEQTQSISSISFNGDLYAFVGIYYKDGTRTTLSNMYKLNKNTNVFDKIQDIETVGTRGCSFLEFDNELYLFVSNLYDGSTYNQNSFLFKLEKDTKQFTRSTTIKTFGTFNGSKLFKFNNKLFLAIGHVNKTEGSTIKAKEVSIHSCENFGSKINKMDETISDKLASISTLKDDGVDYVLLEEYMAKDRATTLSETRIFRLENNKLVKHMTVPKGYKSWGSEFVKFKDKTFYFSGGYGSTTKIVDVDLINKTSTVLGEVCDNDAKVTDITSTVYQDELYVFVGVFLKGISGYSTTSFVYKYVEGSNSFIKVQDIPTIGTHGSKLIVTNNKMILVIGSYYNGSNFTTTNTIYKYDDDQNIFVKDQDLTLNGTRQPDLYTFEDETYLTLASSRGGSAGSTAATFSKVYKYNTDIDKFEEFYSIDTFGCMVLKMFKENDKLFFVAFNTDSGGDGSLKYHGLNNFIYCLNKEKTALDKITDFYGPFTHGGHVLERDNDAVIFVADYNNPDDSVNLLNTIYSFKDPMFSTGQVKAFDRARGENKVLLETKEVDDSVVTIEDTGFAINANVDNFDVSNMLAKSEKQLVSYYFEDVEDDGDGYYDRAFNNTDISFDEVFFEYSLGFTENGVHILAKKEDGNRCLDSSVSGKVYLARDINGLLLIEKKKPSIGKYDKEDINDNRLIYLNDRWWNPDTTQATGMSKITTPADVSFYHCGLFMADGRIVGVDKTDLVFPEKKIINDSSNTTSEESIKLVHNTGFKNLIINGETLIWQRDETRVDYGEGLKYKSVDRFRFQRVSVEKVVDPLYGSVVRLTRNANYTNAVMETPLENEGQFNDRDLVLSFYIKTSEPVTGIRASVTKYADSGKIFDSTYNTKGGVWERKYFVIPKFVSLDIIRVMPFFSDIPDGMTVDITNIQLEEGKKPSNFEHLFKGLVLSICQRHYEKGILGYSFTSTNETLALRELVYTMIEKRVPCKLAFSNGGFTNISTEERYAFNLFNNKSIYYVGTPNDAGVTSRAHSIDFEADAEIH